MEDGSGGSVPSRTLSQGALGNRQEEIPESEELREEPEVHLAGIGRALPLYFSHSVSIWASMAGFSSSNMRLAVAPMYLG